MSLANIWSWFTILFILALAIGVNVDRRRGQHPSLTVWIAMTAAVVAAALVLATALHALHC